jgi:hypothetical protein
MNRIKIFKTNTFSDPSSAILLILIEYPIWVKREWLVDCEITSVLDDVWRFRALNHRWDDDGFKGGKMDKVNL